MRVKCNRLRKSRVADPNKLFRKRRTPNSINKKMPDHHAAIQNRTFKKKKNAHANETKSRTLCQAAKPTTESNNKSPYGTKHDELTVVP